MDESIPITDPIDKMTLELLMNRSQFKKYIAKTDPTKHIENEEKLRKIRKYKHRILGLTSDLLDNPEIMVTVDVNEIFFQYANLLIRYFETKDMEKQDMDVLFDKMDEDDTLDLRGSLSIKKSEEDVPFIKPVESHGRRSTATNSLDNNASVTRGSFWGKDRVVKQSSILDYPLRKGGLAKLDLGSL